MEQRQTENYTLSQHFKQFGAFKKVSKAARKCGPPKTGETIKVPARKAVKFYPGKAFTEQVNTKAKAKKK